MDDYGWIDGERVPLTWHDSTAPLFPGDEAEPMAPRGSGSWWPSDGCRSVRLSELSPAEAGQVSASARRELVWWLAGEGLHPLRWMRRWTGALWSLCADLVPGEARLLFGDRAKFDRAAMESLFSGRSAGAERRRLEGVWAGMGDRLGSRGAAAGDRSRLDDLMAGASALEWCDWAGESEDRGAAEEDASAVARLAMVSLARWIAADGSWGLMALKRFYVLVFVRYRDLAPGMTGQDFGAIYGQTRAAFCEDAKRFVGLPLEGLLGYRPKVAGQKSAESAEAYARNAAEHCPRRQVAASASAGEGDEAAHRRMERARLDAARRAAEARETERAAEEMRLLAMRNRGRGRG
jgi:hypothetical protein